MKHLKSAIVFSAIIALFSCKKEAKKETETIETKTENTKIIGNYVSEEYNKRNDGYDWIAVSVKNISDEKIAIKIRSRADKKKPTCTLDATAFKQNDTVYKASVNGTSILFSFDKNNILINSEDKNNANELYFFCSGGASIAGKYSKINTPLDEKQIDKTSFLKVVELQGIGFTVSSIKKDTTNTLTVRTFGLPHEFNETFTIKDEEITGIEVEDMNVDGSPELLVYTQNSAKIPQGNVHAFSVNNRKSMSMVYFEPTSKNPKINNGYQGNDEFTLIETYLGQVFPIYKNGKKTNKKRQVVYKLIDGEASRRFEIKDIMEF